jgi:transposase-like protein
MAKLTTQEKIQAVKMYLEGIESQDIVAKSVGVSKAILQTWIRQYEHHGEASFKKSYTAYTADYKLMVLNYIFEHGTSIREAAAIFNIPTHSLLSRWKKELEIKGVDGLKSKKKGRPSMKEEKKKLPPVEGTVEALQSEVERLRMENAYLKKLNALVQSKEKLRSKTRRK